MFRICLGNHPTVCCFLPPNTHPYIYKSLFLSPSETTGVSIRFLASFEPVLQKHTKTLYHLAGFHKYNQIQKLNIYRVSIEKMQLSKNTNYIVFRTLQISLYLPSVVSLPIAASLQKPSHIHHSPEAVDRAVAVNQLVAILPI